MALLRAGHVRAPASESVVPVTLRHAPSMHRPSAPSSEQSESSTHARAQDAVKVGVPQIAVARVGSHEAPAEKAEQSLAALQGFVQIPHQHSRPAEQSESLAQVSSQFELLPELFAVVAHAVAMAATV